MAIHARLPDLAHWKAQVKCQTGCPVQTDAGRYVQLIADGRDKEAYLVARAPNPFASVCGRVCAAPCEDACRRGEIDRPIAIRALKRFVTERYCDNPLIVQGPGAGPAVTAGGVFGDLLRLAAYLGARL